MTSNALLHPPPHTPSQHPLPPSPYPTDEMGHSREYRGSRLDHNPSGPEQIQIHLHCECVNPVFRFKVPHLTMSKAFQFNIVIIITLQVFEYFLQLQVIKQK